MAKMKKAKKGKRGLLIFLSVVLILALVYLTLFLWPCPQNRIGDNPLLKNDSPLPRLIAHRGGDGEFPGNTLEAFYNAYSVDENVIMETDANLTSDGVLILCHDTTLDGTTDVTGEISDWSYADLVSMQVNFGYDNDDDSGELHLFEDEDGETVYPTRLENYPYGLPGRDGEKFLVTTFEDLLCAFPENVISVEIKQEGDLGIEALHEAVRIVAEHDAFDRVIFASFHSEVFNESVRMQKADEVPDGFICSPSLTSCIKFFVLYFLGLDSLYGESITLLQIPMEEVGLNLATDALIRVAHEHNVAVQYWTVNDEDEMRQLVEMGADGIMTDYPHKLKAIYDSMK